MTEQGKKSPAPAEQNAKSVLERIDLLRDTVKTGN